LTGRLVTPPPEIMLDIGLPRLLPVGLHSSLRCTNLVTLFLPLGTK
jgi:hypothetical protein